jgi:hypothetical protein
MGSRLALLVVAVLVLVGCAGTMGGEETTAAAALAVGGAGSANAFDAAIKAALVSNPDLEHPQVTRAIAIWGDESTVDLRVQVRAGEYCGWFGVAGSVQDGTLEWHGEPAGPCDE